MTAALLLGALAITLFAFLGFIAWNDPIDKPWVPGDWP